MNLFKKPNIADIFKPVVGSGGLYEEQRTDQKKPSTQLEMTIVGKEAVDGQQGWWMEVGHVAGKSDYFSAAGATGDGNASQFHRQRQQGEGGNGKVAPGGHGNHYRARGYLQLRALEERHGSRACMGSDKGSPMGTVKSVTEDGSSMTAQDNTGATDRITGPVTKFDPQAFVEQHKKPQ
jgi:hypothetical protein